MIELAPGSKRGLQLRGPLILAGGYGGEIGREFMSHAHALLTPPTTLRPHAPRRSETRFLPFPGGFLYDRGGANPGLAAVLNANRHIWRRLDLPVVLSLAIQDRNHWAEIARRASRIEAIAGLELEMDDESDLMEGVDAVRKETDLPLIAKIPILRARDCAKEGFRCTADALTVGLGPRGDARSGSMYWEGRLAGPPLKPMTLRAVRMLAESHPELPLIAAGGVQNAEDVKELLEAGARAVGVDTALWRDPEVIFEIGGSTEQGLSRLGK